MDIPSQRAISIEVGMQNSGLGAALATAHFLHLPPFPVPFLAYGIIYLALGWQHFGQKEATQKIKTKKLVPSPVLAFSFDYPSSNSCSGSSSRFLIVTRNPTASLPSTIRWSYERAKYIIGRFSKRSSSIATGRS